MQKNFTEMETKQLVQLFKCLTNKLENVQSCRLDSEKLIFEIKTIKPHVTINEFVELPIADWFLDQYCLR